MKTAVEFLKLLPGWVSMGMSIARAVGSRDPKKLEVELNANKAVKRLRDRVRSR